MDVNKLSLAYPFFFVCCGLSTYNDRLLYVSREDSLIVYT